MPPKRRYHTQIQSYGLAARMVVHEPRMQTIRRWSGLSEWRAGVTPILQARSGRTLRRSAPRARPTAAFVLLKNRAHKKPGGSSGGHL